MAFNGAADFNIRISKQVRKYILYQRTKIDLKTPLGAVSAKISLYVPFLYHPLVSLRAAYHGPWIDKRFNEIMKKDYATIRDFLPQKEAPVIVDIGCGIAGIDAMLSMHYERKTRFILVDKTRIDKEIHYGFEKEASFYNSLPLAKQTLVDNGVNPEHIVLNTPEEFISKAPQADLVVSLESWGFHYPIATYIETVKKCLGKGGVLIVEVRKNSGALEELQKHFNNVQIIKDEKRQCVVCKVEEGRG